MSQASKSHKKKKGLVRGDEDDSGIRDTKGRSRAEENHLVVHLGD